MIVTEEEAKTKWCPFARVPFGNGTVNGNRGVDGHPDGNKTLCVGSACMAWRSLDEVAGFNDDWTDKRIVIGGYCGLAGNP